MSPNHPHRPATAQPYRPRPAQRAGRATATRQRWRRGWIAIVAVAVALAGTVVGLRLTYHTPTTPAVSSTAVGQPAPDGVFTTVSGATMTVASLRGRPTLLWFVATWCPSCQAGTPVIAQHFAQLRAANVRVVEVELYQNLGQPGPTIADFGRQLAGTEYGNPDWTFATSSEDLTLVYNPDGSTDIYYLLDTEGRIAYVNSAPASTLPDLLAHAATLS